MFVIAQLSTSVSDDQIRLIIIAMLVVAVLLALLTTWYAVKTSPRRRVRAAQARRGVTARTPGARTIGRPAPTGSSTASPGSPPSSMPGSDHDRPAGRRRSEPAVAPDDDEWARLTSPQQQRFPNG